MKTILHPLFRFWIRLTSYFFFDKIKVAGLENLPHDGPVILACNHPNAFLDSIVMTTCVKRQLYYTARGDFFTSKIASALLRFINILPVYRKEEGKELMHKNDETFSYCIELFKKNGALIIFPEAGSVNKWELRPLRKGAARLAYEAWNNPEVSDKLKVVPVAIHYSSWMKLHPVVYVQFLRNIEMSSFSGTAETGPFNKKFNELLKTILSESCIEVDPLGDIAPQNKITGFCLKNFINGVPDAKKLQNNYLAREHKKFKSDYKALSDFLVHENLNYDLKAESGTMQFVNLAGWFIVIGTASIFNFIPYYITKAIVRTVNKDPDFYDSLFYCILMFLYPVYLCAMFSIMTVFTNYKAGLIAIFLAAYSAYYYEASKRFIKSFFKRVELVKAHELFKALFEKGNG